MLLLDQIEFGYSFRPIGSIPGKLTLPHDPEGANITLIQGRNGSGKSTFLRTLAGLLPLLGGHILWQDEPIEEVQSSGRITYLGDRLDFCGELTIGSILDSLLGTSPENARLAELFSLNLKLPWKKLSTGQRQRVRLCLVLRRMTTAVLVLLDEPFSGLDLDSRQVAMDLLQKCLYGQPKRLLICLHQDYYPPGWIQNRLVFADHTFTLQ